MNKIVNKVRVKDVFYRINLQDNRSFSENNGIRDPIAYDTYSNTPLHFTEPLKKLNRLTLRFFTPDGDLYDFNGQDHSFTLEIVTYEEIPQGTSLQVN